MELKRFFKADGTELIVVPFSNNKRWCIVIFNNGKAAVADIFETEEAALQWAQNFINK